MKLQRLERRKTRENVAFLEAGQLLSRLPRLLGRQHPPDLLLSRRAAPALQPTEEGAQAFAGEKEAKKQQSRQPS